MQISLVALRGLQFFLVLVITALVGNVIAEAFAGNPSSVNFAIFVAVFSWIAVLYGLVTAFLDKFSVPIATLALDGIATLLNFIAGVVLAAKLGVHSCGNKAYILGNNLTNGSANPTKRCHELQAATAFFWFLLVAFAASMALSFLSSRGSIGGSVRRGPMSQV